MKRSTRGLGLLASALAGAVTLSSCSLSVAEMPLPGGTDAGEDPMVVKAEFADVLDLVPQSTVKINDVSVGMITEIELDGETAIVTMELPRDTELPDNTQAEIRQTSLLGEKFVSLSPPETGAQGELGNGDVIDLADTGRNPEVEEVLGALSLLLNGGGVAQMKTIAHELNLALGGREDDVKSAFRRIEELMSGFDKGKADIVRAIEGLNRLSLSVSDQMSTIDAALEELPSALRTIDRQRADLVRMLRALNELGDVGVRVIRQSKAATIESFRQLVPVLTKFAESGDDFVNAFHVFLTYPFVDDVVGRDPQVARNLHMGDYTNLSVDLEIDLSHHELPSLPVPTTGLPTDLPTIIDPGETLSLVEKCLKSGDIDSKACQEVLDSPKKLERLKDECKKKKYEDNEVCKALNQLPDVPDLTGGNGNGNGGGGGGLPDLPGLPRPGFDPQPRQFGPRGPTVGELMELYDPDLVQLLVPGMVTR